MEQPHAVKCDFCGNAYTTAEEEAEPNLPRMLVCGHIFCTFCLQSIECDNVVMCPDCKVKSIRPEEGVFGLQEEDRIIGLIYTGKMNRMRRSKSRSHRRITAKSFDTSGNPEGVEQQAPLEKIERAIDESLATAAEHLPKLEHLEQVLTTGLAEKVKKERARLEMEICHGANKAMYTIQKCVSEMSVQQHSNNLSRQLPSHRQVKSLASNYSQTSQGKVEVQMWKVSPGRKSCQSLSLMRHSNHDPCKTSSDNVTPNIMIEEIIKPEDQDVPPTGPELANEYWRSCRNRRWSLSGNKRNVTQWVVVTHVVNPTHFYVRYVAKERESNILSREINNFCQLDTDCFSSIDKVQADSVILAKGYEGLWCRTSVLEVFQNGQDNSLKVCPVNELVGVYIFFIDYGFTKRINIKRNVSSTESSADNVNKQLRKINPELLRFAPQAIRCSLKDLVPYDLTKGWSEEAQMVFCQVVGSAAVEMTSFGQDKDALLVDLNKAPIRRSTNIPISIREYLVFTEVARFYYPVKLSRRPLKYYPAVLPKIHVECSALVTHINSPDDFYIQLQTDNMELSLLKAKLQECYNGKNGEDLMVYCPVIGQACVACFDDNTWYRVEVMGHPRSRNVAVRSIDYGHKTVLSASDLRKMKDEFFSLPTLAIQCCLSDVIPLAGKKWSNACIERFTCLAHNKVFTIIATENSPKTKPLPVKMLKSRPTDTLTDIAEVLITEKLVCSKNGLSELLNECEHLEPQNVEWKPDMFCAAHVKKERGQICAKVSFGNIVEEMKCDHGNKVKLHVSNLQPLCPSLVGSFRLECSLTDIRPARGQNICTPTTCDFMRYNLSGASVPITIQVKTDLYKAPELPQLGHNHLTITAINKDRYIYARTDAAGYHLEQLREKIHQSMKPLPSQKMYKWKTMQGCAVIGPDMLWHRGHVLEALGGHVKVQYVDYGLVENIPVVHVYPSLLCEDIPQLCVACQLDAINSLVGSWHQNAVVLLSEMLLYRRVDVNVVKLPTNPRQPLTVEIVLDGMNLSSILYHYKHTLMDPAKLAPPLPTPPISDIWDIDIKGLLDLQEGMLGPVTLPSLPELDQSLNVRVKHLETPNKVFLWWEDTAKILVNGQCLDEQMTRINVNVQNLLPLNNFPQESCQTGQPPEPSAYQRKASRPHSHNNWGFSGGPCLAEYVDVKFYRAEMLKIICANPVQILIKHVDFGSDDIVPTSKLRQMPAELLRFPAQVLKVHVGGFKPPSISTEGPMLPYSAQWSLKATLAMIEQLHGDLTAIVLSGVKSSEPSVLLYDRDGQLVFLPLVASGLAQLE
ncbi:LOW QUALITY PROTEIN: RING finger protein 17 [Syngnathoides biaculeatus]|uniref:LOW QUALITY PROTEIN: RING finger protein 17 n=1 Tax=Syngnathoides biaculeatus TaxID=300417 RepID=UPI002ADE68A8|nr:LOW QUALITY PROTEIN: RING finger protein 17 [Syngnathoides biaculeatus]